MEKFHAMFHGTDVYINGKYKYNSNEILTAYLNLNLDMKYLTDLHFYMRQSMKNLKLRTGYSDEERFVDYEKNVQWAQKLIDEVDAIRLKLPPYNRIVDSQQAKKNVLRRRLYDFIDMLDGNGMATVTAELAEEDDDEDYCSAFIKFVPIDMYWYWEDSDSQFAMENMARMNELNQAIEDLMQPYIHWVEDVLRVKCCYEKLLSDFLHIKHGFLTEADLAKQFQAYFKTESMAGTAHRKLNGPAPLTSCHEVFTPEKGTPFLCASYDFDRLGAFLYEDFFRGLAEHFIPKRCSNCGKWFLIDAGIYSDYCENPLAEDKAKTCRMVSARKKYDTKCKEDPIWNIYNKAYKAHYARIAKKKMTKAEFEAWSRYAVELREQAERNEISFEEYVRTIKK